MDQTTQTLCEDSKNNIVLIGMPGVGKSTVGVVLAKILNFDFLDVDLLIQKQYASTLQDLIDTHGAEKFIAMEGAILANVASDRDVARTVISTGGSAIYSQAAMERLSANSTIVYLRVGLDELSGRLQSFSNRGVVMRNANCCSLEDLYDERTPLYERHAQVIVDTDDMSISDVALKIAEHIDVKA